MAILNEKSFIAGFDQFFKDYAEAWGQSNDTRVVVDFLTQDAATSLVKTEAMKQTSHDIALVVDAAASYEDQVIDHREIYEECKHRYGPAADLAIKNTFNVKTKKFFAFRQGYVPTPINYRRDLWQAVGVVAESWKDFHEEPKKEQLRKAA